jgi:hypothetical protein
LQEFENASDWRDPGNRDPTENLVQRISRPRADGNLELLQLLELLELLFFLFLK